MLQRIRKCFGIENDNDLDNIGEVDETYVGGKNKNKHYNKKSKHPHGRSTVDKVPVVGLVERGGKVNAYVVKNTSGRVLKSEIMRYVKRTDLLCTDEWFGYNGLSRFYNHLIVNHGTQEYVNGNAYTNTLEGFWWLLKRGILGIYHFTSKKHLQLYVDEFVFRYNTKDQEDSQRFNWLLSNIGFRTKYRELLNG